MKAQLLILLYTLLAIYRVSSFSRDSRPKVVRPTFQCYYYSDANVASATTSRRRRIDGRANHLLLRYNFAPSKAASASSLPTTPVTAPAVPDSIVPLIDAVLNATVQRSADTTNQGHDSFRYEWGTWIDESHLEDLMHVANQVRLLQPSHFYEAHTSTSSLSLPSTTNNDPSMLLPAAEPQPRRFRVAGGESWDILLHVLPPGTEWQGRWPTGSWAILKCLTGLVEIDALSGPDREGNYKRRGTTRPLRGGADGSLGSGQSSKGDDSVRYVGGPLRRYSGKYGKTILLEAVVRPPIGKVGAVRDDVPTLDDLDNILTLYQEPPPVEPESAGDAVANNEPLPTAKHLGAKLGMNFERVGGLDVQLDAIARRVLASRANPAAARRLGVSHVRGILLSGPPGCGKTLLARELARLLGAREPQIVNGPEILDKYIGEAEKKVRDLFLPAEQEYRVAGDDSALHIIILDEMDAIARKRGTMTSDTTGVRDSVVNQLLAKMDGVREATNVLVVGLTNRPELLDPALLRPGRLEVQLRVELPDLAGRRDILRIHTRQMREAGGLCPKAVDMLDDLGDHGIPARTEHYSGAELAGLVRSAASFALGRTLEGQGQVETEGVVTPEDLELALKEVVPALGKQDEVLKLRYPLGISPHSPSMERILRDLNRFTAVVKTSNAPRIHSLLLVGAGGTGGAGVSALSAWAASKASANGEADYVRLLTALDVITGCEGSGEDARAAALVERFSEARELPRALLVLDDIDQLCAGTGNGGYSSVMLATLRALLRTPPSRTSSAQAGSALSSSVGTGTTLRVLATTSRSDAACNTLHEIFDETVGKTLATTFVCDSEHCLVQEVGPFSQTSLYFPIYSGTIAPKYGKSE